MSGPMDGIEILRRANPVPLGSIDDTTLPSAADVRTSLRAESTPLALAPVEAGVARGGRWRRPLLVAAAAVLVAGLATVGFIVRDRQPASDPVTTVNTTPSPPDGSSVPSTASAPTTQTSGGMWPQSSVEEVRAAQAFADAGDPGYTWQVDPGLSSEDGEPYFGNPSTEIVERFLREELGWDTFLFSPFDPSWDDQTAGRIAGLVYLRCGSDVSNTLYPAAPCTPTIDEISYETVSIDLAQLDEHGPTGLWVVSGWRLTTPVTQTDWRVTEAELIARLDRFLTARVAGEGAEGFVVRADFGPEQTETVPLLYATSAGSAYERYDVDRVSEPVWPWGHMSFEVRLLADGGDTVVAQDVAWDGASLLLSARSTTENGQPVAVRYSFFDGEVTVAAAVPWTYLFEEDGLALGDQFGDRHLDLAPRPRPVTAGCTQGPVPTDVNALAESIRARPDLEVTEPKNVTVGGVDGLMMDVRATPTPDPCESNGTRVIWKTVGLGQRRAFALEPGQSMRLYLLDVPDGSDVWPMAIAVVAPEERFEETVEQARPVIESIEFPRR